MQQRFPTTRPRRARNSQNIRNLVSETSLLPEQMILPVFVTAAKSSAEIPTMPGVRRQTIEDLHHTCEKALKLGVTAIAPFPQIDVSLKDDRGTEAFNTNGLIPQCIRSIKSKFPEMVIIADVALDPYTSHGQDGIIDRDGYILNDVTTSALVNQATVLAEAGADMVAPSDMMDGRIGAIRNHFEEKSMHNTMIMAYAAKYASSFYGPFRDAVSSASNLAGRDKATYQMDPRNSDEALLEAGLDVSEGADIVIVKPAMPYLDIISKIKANLNIPICAYQVSGEYAMLQFAAQNQALDLDKVMLESLISIRRAGASSILTYFALDAAKLLNKM